MSKSLANDVQSGSIRVEEAIDEETLWVVEPPQITVEENVRKATFDILGVIWEGSEAEFRRELRSMGNVDEVEVNINTPGGDYNASLSIFNALASLDAKVTTRVVGAASSGGSIILQAGEDRVVTSTGRVMVHRVQPTQEQIRNFLKRIEDADEVLAQLYIDTNTANLDEAGVTELFENGDNNMTGEEAVKAGFADRVEKVTPKRSSQKTKNDESAPLLTLSADFNSDRALDLISNGISALEKKRKAKAKATSKPRLKAKQTTKPQNKGKTKVGFAKWLEENHGIDAASLTEEMRNQWLQIYTAEKAASVATLPGDGDGDGHGINAKGGDGADLGDLTNIGDYKKQIREANAAEAKHMAMLNKAFPNDPEIVATALDEEWDEKDIEIAQYKTKLAKKGADGQIFHGRDYNVITSKGSGKDLNEQSVLECAFMRSALGVKYDKLKNIWGDSEMVDREALGYGVVDVKNFDDATYEAAGKIMVRHGQIDFRHAINAFNGNVVRSDIDLEMDLQNAFSNVSFLAFLKESFNRALIANFTEAQLIYPQLVNIVNGDYRDSVRYRLYDVGHMRKVPKGGTLVHGELDMSEAYRTSLDRYAMIMDIDECYIEQGDMGTVQGLINRLAATARRAPEEVLFDFINEKHCVAGNQVEFNQEYFDAIWEMYCDCTLTDPNDPSNTACNRGKVLDGIRPQILGHKINARKFKRQMNGVVQVCGNTGTDCTTVYTGNLNGDDDCGMDLVISSRLACRDGVVVMPAANSVAPAFVMSVWNGIQVPLIRRFQPPVNKLSIPIQALFRFGIHEADTHLHKNGADVQAYIDAQTP